MDTALYAEIVERRRQFTWPGYQSYADAGLEGAWITPYHLSSVAFSGPVLLTYNFLDAPTALAKGPHLRAHGYLAEMPFNRVLDLGLALAGMRRADIYVTHAFHLLANDRSERIPNAALDASFDAVARHEMMDRPVIALGDAASRQCARHGIPHHAMPHLSARGLSFAHRAEKLATALRSFD